MTARTRLRAWLQASLLIASASLVAACATGPQYSDDEVETGLTAEEVVADPETWLGARVIWGGRILQVHHLEDATQLELVSFPLDRSQRPQIGASPQGRFLVEYPGFLETADYKAGRHLTVLGTVERMREGRIGERRMNYPVVVPEEELYLWREGTTSQPQTRVHFGVGIMFAR